MRFASFFVLVSLCAAVASATTTGDPSSSIELRAQPFEVQLFPARLQYAEADSKSVIVTSTPSESNFMLTIAANAIGGALVGILIGGAIYLLQAPGTRSGVNMAWWVGGGTLVGVEAGVIQVGLASGRDSAAVSGIDDPSERQVLAWATSF